ncbi:MAG: glycosyltransferase family 9 protein [Prevotella sp.]|nr:glycosyltransferase family 9 protein [Prevotella sp.]
MPTVVERLKIALSAIGIHIANKVCSHPQNKKVLLIFQQVFGDSIILLPALEGYVELYHRRMGYEVTMICLPSIKKFFEANARLPEGLHLETVEFKKFVNEYSYFKKTIRRYRMFAEISVVMGTSLSAELLSTTLCAKERHGLISCFRVKWPIQIALFQRLAYTDTVIPPVGSMMIERHGIMLRHLGLESYKGHLSSLLPHNRVVEGNYCVICPGASTPVKCWPIERFSELADWIIETYDMDVHLCGGAPERVASKQLIAGTKHANRIINHVGETSFAEWSAIVQHASLVIGNDSATLHIAAATKRKCICIAGLYDKYMFFPYKVEKLNIGEHLPTTILVDKPCAYCRTKGYFAGYGNNECHKAIKSGKCALCISEISIEDVKGSITRLN